MSAWIKASAYALAGTGAQILFRGDDRPGLDPFTFVIHSDGRIYFAIQDQAQNSPNVSIDIPLNQWTHILASFSAKTGELRMYKDGELVSRNKCKFLPLKELDSFSAPGIGIGNVQWNGGPHNQPFQGTLADVRLYNAVLAPKAVGFNPKPWKNSSESNRG